MITVAQDNDIVEEPTYDIRINARQLLLLHMAVSELHESEMDDPTDAIDSDMMVELEMLDSMLDTANEPLAVAPALNDFSGL